MTSWHRNRRGRGCTTPRCRSQNIANNTFSEGWLQKSKAFAGLRTAPATHHAKNTANTTFSCGMLQNAGFGTIPCGGGGGVVANREPGTYICHGPKYRNPKKCHASFSSNILRIARKFGVRFCWVRFSWPLLLRFAPHRRLDTKSISACTKSSARDEESDELKRKIIDSKPPWLWKPKCQCFRGLQNPTFCRFFKKKEETQKREGSQGRYKHHQKPSWGFGAPDSPCSSCLPRNSSIKSVKKRPSVWKVLPLLKNFRILLCAFLSIFTGNFWKPTPKLFVKRRKKQPKKKRRFNSSNSLSFPKVAAKAPKRSLRRSATLPAAPSSGTKPWCLGKFLSHLGGSSWWKILKKHSVPMKSSSLEWTPTSLRSCCWIWWMVPS